MPVTVSLTRPPTGPEKVPTTPNRITDLVAGPSAFVVVAAGAPAAGAVPVAVLAVPAAGLVLPLVAAAAVVPAAGAVPGLTAAGAVPVVASGAAAVVPASATGAAGAAARLLSAAGAADCPTPAACSMAWSLTRVPPQPDSSSARATALGSAARRALLGSLNTGSSLGGTGVGGEDLLFAEFV